MLAGQGIFANELECVILEHDENEPVSLDASAQLQFFCHEDTHLHNSEACEEGCS